MATEQIEVGDADLVHAARCGEVATRKVAFEALVIRYSGFIRAMLRGLCRNTAQADDLAQETFLKAWLKLDVLREPAAFAGWLKQLAYREFLHAQRRLKLELHHAAETQSALRQRSQAEGAKLDNGQLDVELDDELVRLLEVCTPLERELMILIYGFEFTQVEIATARSMALGTVKSHIHRAKLKMRSIVTINSSQSLESDHS